MVDTKIKVLIVDDTRTVRLQLKTFLRNARFEVVEAESGAQALEKIKERKPDVILMDVMMPDMDGIECSRTIKSDPELEDIRIIMVTGAKDYQRISEAYNAGCNDYITKPVEEADLLRKIDKVVRLFRIIQRTRSTIPGNLTAPLETK